jgi:hypothetical protein
MASVNGKQSESTLPQPPAGFVRIGAVADAPWFVLEDGNTIHGKLLGVYDREDKRSKTGRSKFFQVELISTCKVRAGRGEEAKVSLGRPGTVVNLNYTPLTKVLETFSQKILTGGEYNVYAPCGRKKELANGNTMWLIDVHVQVVREPEPLADQEPDFGSDDPGQSASE